MTTRAARHLAPVASTPTTPDLVVQLTTTQLRAIVREEVDAALGQHVPPAPPDPATDWIDAEAAARILGCSRDYVRRVTGLPKHGSRTRPRYRRSEVEAFVAALKGAPLKGGA